VTNQQSNAVQSRIDHLQARLRILTAVLAMSTVVICALAWRTVAAQEPSSIIRARGIVIVDDQGHERIVIGAPVPSPKEGTRRSASTGIIINDQLGYERFGLGLTDDGQMGMGFDAPRGTGDDRNRERINVVADAKGGSEIRFLNRKTFVAGRLSLNSSDQFYVEFLSFPEGKILSRQMMLTGDQTGEKAR
jgi:hypothetical protein